MGGLRLVPVNPRSDSESHYSALISAHLRKKRGRAKVWLAIHKILFGFLITQIFWITEFIMTWTALRVIISSRLCFVEFFFFKFTLILRNVMKELFTMCAFRFIQLKLECCKKNKYEVIIVRLVKSWKLRQIKIKINLQVAKIFNAECKYFLWWFSFGNECVYISCMCFFGWALIFFALFVVWINKCLIWGVPYYF